MSKNVKWPKGTTLETAYKFGKLQGRRNALEILFKEGGFDNDFMICIIEEWIKKNYKNNN